MIKLLITVVLIYGLKLEHAVFWYIAAGIAGGIDCYFWNTWDVRILKALAGNFTL